MSATCDASALENKCPLAAVRFGATTALKHDESATPLLPERVPPSSNAVVRDESRTMINLKLCGDEGESQKSNPLDCFDDFPSTADSTQGDTAQTSRTTRRIHNRLSTKFSNKRTPFGKYPEFFLQDGLFTAGEEGGKVAVTASSLVAIGNSQRRFIGNTMMITEEDLIETVTDPEAETSDAAVIISSGDSKEPIGYFIAEINVRTGQCYLFIRVDPEKKGWKEVYEAGLYEGIAAIRSHLEDIAGGKPVVISCKESPQMPYAIKRLRDEGFQYNRSWFVMSLCLTEKDDFPDTPLPDGLELRPFRHQDPKQCRQMYEAEQEAFRDHSGYAEDLPWEEWLEHWEEKDLATYKFFVAWDGNQIAGAVWVEDGRKSEPGMAYIDIVFVRRPYRGRGLAGSLLRKAIRDAKLAGFTKVTLHVDGKSKTNALALYQRVGLQISLELQDHRLLLMGNPEDVVD